MLPDIGFDVYPIFIVLAVFSALVCFELYCKRRNKDRDFISTTELVVIFSAIVAVITAILFQNLYDFIENPQEYHWTWAMTFFGGIFGGVATYLVVYFLYLRKKYGPHLKEMTIIAGMAIPLAHAIGRIGCVLDGCCYGIETDSIFGIQFKTTDTKVYPTNLFECIFLFILAGILIYLCFARFYQYSLQTYMICYGAFRFGIEFIRGDHRGNLIPGLSPSQFWAMLLFIGGILYLILSLIYENRRKNKEIQA